MKISNQKFMLRQLRKEWEESKPSVPEPVMVPRFRSDRKGEYEERVKYAQDSREKLIERLESEMPTFEMWLEKNQLLEDQ